MKLRTRLFLWVAIIFFIAFGFSIYFEVRLTEKHLRVAEANLKKQILEINETDRQNIENYLAISLGDDQAQIDALLLRIGRDNSPLDTKAWQGLGVLFRNNDWVDFFQATQGSDLAALLIPLNRPMNDAREEKIDSELSWVLVKGQEAYLGIALTNQMKTFYTLEALKGMGSTDNEPLNRAIALAKTAPQPPEWKEVPSDDRLCLAEGVVTNHMVDYLQRADQAMMIEALTALFPSAIYGESPLAERAPAGIARFDTARGSALFSKDIFLRHSVYSSGDYVRTHPSGENCSGVSSALDVVSLEHVFISNTVSLPGKGYITVGMDIDHLAKSVVTALHEALLLVSGGKQVGGYFASGEKMGPFPFDPTMLENTSGLVNWQNTSYYYLHMQPYKELDLHFFLLKPEKEAFAFINSIDEGTRSIIHKLSSNMRMISLSALFLVLLLANGFAKRITKPISKLALATEHVAAGKFENVELPVMPPSRHDEIAILCQSFEKMIVGLKDREKVKGVLNKVVSPEIASAILKSDIRLGGEERKVTVLFADIRHFTQMTAHLDPEQVIAMLNTCMTRISHVIDEFGGVIDKYVGDEVMALFGAPIEDNESALHAIQCAIRMVEVLKTWNTEPKVEMGIGIHTGLVLVGNMGAENRLNYTVIGRNVNLAARLCSAAAGMQILISEETLNEPGVKEKVAVTALPAAELKGFDEKIPLFQVNT